MSDHPRLWVDVDGGLVRLRAEYEPELVERIRRLPGRRFLRDRAEWTVPATREGLTAVCDLVEEAAVEVQLSDAARARLARNGPGRVELDGDEARLIFGYNRRRIERVKAIPERRFDPKARIWMLPMTRAGALALIALLDEREFRAEPSVRVRLESIAAGTPRSEGHLRTEASGARRSPIPHWRHVTRGRVFDANAERHEWVEGVGWCVRIRVDPAVRRRSVRGEHGP